MSPDRFEAMGVDVLVGGATEAELEAVGLLFEKLDRTFSRFRSDSELNRVNAATAEFVAASPMFVRVLALALDAARRTDGLVDPTLGAAIEAAGYDRDFAELADDERPPSAAVPGSWRHVRVAGPLVFRYPGTKLDLNCVVKGLAVDAAVQQLAGDGFVAAGGDVAVRGAAGVGLPGGGSLTLRDGGLATSGTTYRRWLRGGDTQHHLIDPRTGRPSTSPWSEVTVAAGSCLEADVAAKAALLLGDDGPNWLDERELPGRFRAGDREVANESWRRALEPAKAA
ncbi:MAG: FAD:protein FMN transferase [Actinobacteria bacterium]|nr:MAG: FAD:protein FMN transferase [Actinomycetota bacterium]